MTRDLQNLHLLAKLMALHYQILFSLATAATAEAILIQTSAEQSNAILVQGCPQVFETGYSHL